MRVRALAMLLSTLSVTAAADTVDLKNGDTLTGEIVERSDTTLIVEHAVLGRLTIPLEHVKPPKSENPGLFGTSFLAGWTRAVQIGVTGSQGNSKNTNVAVALDLDYKDDHERWAFDVAYQFGASEGETSQHSGFSGLRHDWLLADSRWFLFGLGRADYDQFRSWKYRISGAAGLGYEFEKSETWNLRGLLGPSVTQEFDENNFYVEALVGLESVWTFNEFHSLSLTNTIYPALNDLGEFRNLSTFGWKWRLSEQPALSLNSGVRNEYQSQVESGRKHDDLTYTTAIGIDF